MGFGLLGGECEPQQVDSYPLPLRQWCVGRVDGGVVGGVLFFFNLFF